MAAKICLKCGIEKNLDAFVRDKRRKDGLCNWCRECDKHYYQQNKEHKLEQRAKNRKANTETLAEYHRNYRKEHREHYVEYENKHRTEHREYYLEYKKQYQQEHGERLNEISKTYHKEHKEQDAKTAQRWRQSNPEKRRLSKHRRTALEQQVAASLTVLEWGDAKAYFNNSCAYCGGTGALQQDHFVPVSSFGGYSRDNIIPVCPRCNYSKCAASFSDWYPRQPFYSQQRADTVARYLQSQIIQTRNALIG